MKIVITTALVVMVGFLQAQPSYLPVKRITATVDGYPVLSPDGKKILFESDRTGNSELYTMNVDGTDLKQLTFNDANDDSPTFSPDGKRIAFTSLRESNDAEIFIMDADGKNAKRLTSTPGDDSHPKFSPDGQRIIFNSARSTPDLTVDWGKQHIEIFSMKTDGTDIKQLTTFKTVTTYASLSPDGKKLLFRKVLNTPGFNWDLTTSKRNSETFVMNLDGTGEINLSDNAAYDGWPVWTPDGRVIFASNRSGVPSRSALYLVNADGTGLKIITDPRTSYNQHSVSADGKWIAAERNAESFAGIDLLEFKE
jgi:TolB protein